MQAVDHCRKIVANHSDYAVKNSFLLLKTFSIQRCFYVSCISFNYWENKLKALFSELRAYYPPVVIY